MTTTCGNIDVDQATRNTLALLEAAGRSDIPVAAGARRSLTRPYTRTASRIHGPNGFGGLALPEPKASARD